MLDSKTELKEKLKAKLREIFQFENEDLDFGIYRIMNYKRKEIEKFIEKELIEEVVKQLELAGEEEIEKIKAEFEKIKQKIKEALGENAFVNGELKEEFKNTPLGREYYERKRQIEEIKISEDLEKEIYNHLINFFSRYYDKGDFISKRRYGKNEKYVIPYNGEEVLLYWANKDQYYIKTTEYFRRYSFKVKDLTVNFRVVEAEEEKGNVKSSEKKFFVLSKKVFDFDKEKRELNIYFEYRGLTEKEKEKYKHGQSASQDKINEGTVEILKKKIPKNSVARLIFEKDPNSKTGKTYIEKHLYKYTRRNTTDYFIHKDLKGFLERELDFYIKNEFLNLEDLRILEESGYFDRLRLYLIGVRAFRKIALKIIEFLAQIENFQKKLWEKKKFVIDTHYVITLDKIKEYAGEEFLESILDEILNNKKQLEEWKELFGIEVKSKDDLLENNEQLQLNGKEWKKLPLDTKYFNDDFKWKLLVALSRNNDLDEILDGTLIKSENWQALNLLTNKFKEKIDCIHIDPPYNTLTSGFLYKNNYRHSSWLTMMENRISISIPLLKPEGSFQCHIDENEYERLHLLFEQFPLANAGTVVWDKRNPMTASRGVALQHEYIIWRTNTKKPIYLRNRNIKLMLNKAREIVEKYGGVTEEAKKEYAEWVTKNPNLSGGEKAYRYLDDDGRIYQTVSLRAPEPRTDPKFFIPLIHPVTGKPCPVPPNGFSRTPETLQAMVKRGEIVFGPDETTQPRQKKLLTEEYKRQITSVIQDAKRGKADLDALGLENFPYCHPVSLYMELIGAVSHNPDSLILDFFAGSGTTAHAVIKLNKEDGGKRKFILVELADYFDTVVIPRIKKIAYSLNWKEGKPQDMDGTGVFFQYHTLEQYEDALENIEFEEKQDERQKKILLELPDYFVKYMLEWETKENKTFLNLKELKDPFNYKIKIIENYRQKTVNVDLVETFNYLLGLHLKGYRMLKENGRRYVFVFGEKDRKKVAVVWRSIKDINFERDREIIEENLKDFNPDEIYINGDALVKGFRHIEPLFKSLMFERVET